MDLDLIRNNLELEFRLKLYKDPCFPFLQSMGKKNIYQEFYLNQKESIGILHLRWNNKNSELYYMGKNKIEITPITGEKFNQAPRYFYTKCVLFL